MPALTRTRRPYGEGDQRQHGSRANRAHLLASQVDHCRQGTLGVKGHFGAAAVHVEAAALARPGIGSR